MPLKLNVKKEKNGTEINVQHWEIDGLYFNKREKYLLIELRGYVSKAKRDEAEATGANTDEYRFRFSMSNGDFPDVTKKDFMKDVFAFIKKQKRHGIDWTKAVDS